MIIGLLLATMGLALALPPQNPVIGIYTQYAVNSQNISRTYIAASYVKYLEMSGAQVVPIFSNSTQETIQKLLSQINGVLFPGGDNEIDISNKWTQNAKFILDFAKQQNDDGKVFPVWGTCLGHQLLSYLTADNDPNVLERVDGQAPNVNSIQFINKSSDIFSNFTAAQLDAVSTGKGVLYFSHHWATYTKYFNSSQSLYSFWNLISKTTSPSGQEFVSAQQAKKYPFFSTQFHPQKNPFEFKVDANRTQVGIQVVQILSNNFVQKARQSPNRFMSSNDQYRLSIHNYQAVAPDRIYDLQSFQQIYLFNENF